MLEGKELEGKIGEVGEYFVDVEKNGQVTISLTAKKELEGVLVSSENKAVVNVITLLEKVAAKTEAKWDEAVVDQIKTILGLIG